MRSRVFAAAALAAAALAAAADPVYWWRYPNTDAEKLDIKQLPCGAGCTLDELEQACLNTTGCVAFNTHGWLKNSITDMAPDSCDLYVKMSTPQPTPPPPPPIYFWPIPVSVSMGASNVTVSNALTFTVSPAISIVQDYAERLAGFIFQNHPADAPPAGSLANVNVVVANPNAPLVLGVDESYTLTIPLGGRDATITANTSYGAMMGLQTLSQAIRFNFDVGQYMVAAAPLNIADAPKFAWRGILIDTDRHWLSLPYIYSIIDALGYSKMNILHWHIVDWQSWPLQSKAYPGLWSAAWSSRERYTLGDVAAVIAYANARGIRVVPEFDTPGHATSMCVGYPELCCEAAGCNWPSNSPLTPVPDANGNNVSLNAIGAVLAELAAISGDEFFHLGGDEVDQTCWQNSPSVTAWMAKQGFTTTDQVYEYFVAQVDAMALGLGKSPIRWEEVWAHFGTQLDRRTIIHAWLSSAAAINATNNGYRAIWSVDGQYYLDAIDEPWTQFYDVDILAGFTNETAKALLMGGEMEQWGETADGSEALATIFPRAAAGAERLWSYDVVTNSSDPTVLPRLQAFRCLLLERNVPAAPVTNSVARSAPSGPGSCMLQ